MISWYTSNGKRKGSRAIIRGPGRVAIAGKDILASVTYWALSASTYLCM